MTEPTASTPELDYREGRGYTVASFVLAVLAVALIPPVHGVIGAVLGYVGWRKGDPLGRTAAACSVLGMVLGAIVAVTLYGAAV